MLEVKFINGNYSFHKEEIKKVFSKYKLKWKSISYDIMTMKGSWENGENKVLGEFKREDNSAKFTVSGSNQFISDLIEVTKEYAEFDFQEEAIENKVVCNVPICKDYSITAISMCNIHIYYREQFRLNVANFVKKTAS